MATGRTLPVFERLYIGGYDMSGYSFNSGTVGVEYPEYGEASNSPWADPVVGVLVGQPKVLFGPLNGTFDNTATSGLHVTANAAQGAARNLMFLRGVRAAPAFGDDCFCAPMIQSTYQAVGDDIVTVTANFGQDANSGLNYDEFWGKVLHLLSAESGANSANTNVDNGAASAVGGWMMYQITSITGSGTATVSVDDSANGTAWSALSGATSGAIATASAPTSGFVQLAVTATVRRYLRWQVAFGGSATACTFALAFMRGRVQ
jgi:hypothetical protein